METGQGHETDHPTPCNTEVKNVWSCTSTISACLLGVRFYSFLIYLFKFLFSAYFSDNLFIYLFNPHLTLYLFLYLFPYFFVVVLSCLRSFSVFSSLDLSVSLLVVSACLISCFTTSCINTSNGVVFPYKIVTRTRHVPDVLECLV